MKPLLSRLERLESAAPTYRHWVSVLVNDNETEDQAIARTLTERGLSVRPANLIIRTIVPRITT
jgi:hypothetical protein